MSILVKFEVHIDSMCYQYELVKWNTLHNCKLHILVLSHSIQFLFHVTKSLGLGSRLAIPPTVYPVFP